jgi:hypothetical protein
LKSAPDGFVLHLCSRDDICVSDRCSCKYSYILYF